MDPTRSLHWKPTGLFPRPCAGTSYYKDEIAAVAKNPKRRSALVFCTAVLVPEDENPHDANAVLVLIEGKKVGHLPRADAEYFRFLFKKFGLEIQKTTCDAVITKGFSWEDRDYDYRIELDVPSEPAAPAAIAPTYPVVDRRDSTPILRKQADGTFLVEAFLDHIPPQDPKHRDIASWTDVRSWTVDDGVIYLLAYGRGGENRLFKIPTRTHDDTFGDNDPHASIASITGRTAVVAFEPTPSRSLVQRNTKPDAAFAPSPTESQSAPQGRYVFAHVDELGVPFFIGVGTGREAWAVGARDPFWHRYVEKHLHGKYSVAVVADNLNYFAASELKSAWMQKSPHTLVNYANPGRMIDRAASDKYWSLRDSFKQLRAAARRLEKSDVRRAIVLYYEALEKVDSYSVIQPEGGIFGRLLCEIREENGLTGSIFVLDRLTLCLVRMGRVEEANALTKRYFEKYRGDERESATRLIKKRVAKAAACGS